MPLVIWPMTLLPIAHTCHAIPTLPYPFAVPSIAQTLLEGTLMAERMRLEIYAFQTGSA